MTDISGSDSSLETASHAQTPAARTEPTPDLAGLMPRIGAGDQGAFEQFYRATLARANALVRRIVHDSHAVDDVLEEAYWQVWRDAARYAPERGVVLAWFMTICRTRALDHLRRQGPAQSHPDPHELQTEQETMALSAAAPADLLEACQAQGRLHEAIGLLSARERQMIALAFFRDCSYQEIALSFDMPLSSVKTIMRRAFAKLKATMQQHDVSTTLQ